MVIALVAVASGCSKSVETYAPNDVPGNPGMVESAGTALTVQVGALDARSDGLLQLSLSGNGVRVGLWDAGSPLLSHQEFGGRVVYAGSESLSNDDHATSVSGIIGASGTESEARGVAPAVLIDAYNSGNDLAGMTAASAAGLRISVHPYTYSSGWVPQNRDPESYPDAGWTWRGDIRKSETEDFVFGYYSAMAADWDALAWDHPHYLIIMAAGNQHLRGPENQPASHWYYDFDVNDWVVADASDGITRNLNGEGSGSSSITFAALAKNVLTVGNAGFANGRYDGPASVIVDAASGRGPADDGRVKPDLVAPSAAEFVPKASGTAAYGSFAGTSASSALVTGTAALILEHYRERYSKDPLSSTYRALFVHTSDPVTGSSGPDYVHGWGVLNASAALRYLQAAPELEPEANYDGIPGVLHREETLAEHGIQSYSISHDGRGALRFTLAWTDPPGAVIDISDSEALNSRTPVLVNDLDIRAVSPSGVTWLPWALDPDDASAPAIRADNLVDTIEQIYVPSGQAEAGVWTITVQHKGTLSGGSQDFSLFAGPHHVHYRTYTSADAGWRLMSAPFLDVPFSSLNGAFFTQGGPSATWSAHEGAASNLLWYQPASDETYGTGFHAVPAEGGEFQSGHGYLFYVYDENPPGEPDKQWLPATWYTHGEPSEDVNIVISAPAGPETWFLAGNPWQDALDWEQVFAASSGLSAGIALWNPELAEGAGGTSGYVYYSAMLDLGDPRPLITPGTGFFVGVPAHEGTEPVEAVLRMRKQHRVRGETVEYYGKNVAGDLVAGPTVGPGAGGDHTLVSGTAGTNPARREAPFMRLIAESEGGARSEVRMVFDERAQPGADVLDMPRAVPLVPQSVEAVLIENGRKLAWDVRDALGESQIYKMQVCSDGDGPVTLRAEGLPGTNLQFWSLSEGAGPESVGALEDGGQALLYVEGCELYRLELTPSLRVTSGGGGHPDLQVPLVLRLDQNYPNPFNATTRITAVLPEAGRARLEVFDLSGRRVMLLSDGHLSAGEHQFTINATSLASGVYLYRLQTPSGVRIRKMLLLK